MLVMMVVMAVIELATVLDLAEGAPFMPRQYP